MPRKADLLQTATPQLNGLCQSWGCLKGFDEVLQDPANVIGGVFLQHAPPNASDVGGCGDRTGTPFPEHESHKTERRYFEAKKREVFD
jgi:hypothetical protein